MPAHRGASRLIAWKGKQGEAARPGCASLKSAHDSGAKTDESMRELEERARAVNERQELLRTGEVGEHNSLDLGSDAGLRHVSAPKSE